MKLGPLLLALLLTSSGCGYLIGNVEPVEEKSEHYLVMDLSKTDSDWKKIDNGAPKPAERSEAVDMAFQSKKTNSIISINSTCRPSLAQSDQSLEEFTQVLLLGITETDGREAKEISLRNTPALETTLQGKLNGEPVKIRTVVVKYRYCVYDLMYFARPENFEAQAADFELFVSSLKLD